MEVDLVDARTVGPPLRLGDEGVDLSRVLLHGRRDVELVDDDTNVVQVAVLVMVVVIVSIVVMMLVMMVVLVDMLVFQLLVAVHRHPHVGPVDAAPRGGSRLHLHARQPEAVHPADELPLVDQLAQSPHQHVARGAHATFQVKRFHQTNLPYSRLFAWLRIDRYAS